MNADRRTKARMWSVTAVSVVVALVCNLPGRQTAAFVPAPQEPSALAALVPADALGFTVIKTGEGWKTPPGCELQKLFAAQPALLKPMDETLGHSTLDVEIFAAILLDPNEHELELVIASKNLDQAAVRKVRAGDEKKKAANGKEFFIGKSRAASFGADGVAQPVNDPEGRYIPAIHFVNDKTYVTGSMFLLKKYLERDPKAQGNLSRFLAEADKHHLTISVDFVAYLKREVPELPTELAPLLEARLLTLTGDIGTPWKVRVAASFEDEAKAKAALKPARDGFDELRTQLGELAGDLKRTPLGPFFEKPMARAMAALKQAAIKQDANSLELAVEADLEFKFDNGR